MVSFTPQPLYPRGKIPRQTLIKRPGGPEHRRNLTNKIEGQGGGEGVVTVGIWNYFTKDSG